MPIVRESDTGLYAGFEHVALGPLEFSDLDPKADGSAPDAITFSESGNPETLLQVQEEPDSGISLAPGLEGTYYSNDARSDVSILIEGDDLILSIRGDYSASRKFRIEKYTDSSLGIRNIDEPAAGCGMMIRERDENGNVTSFDINTIRSRHLSFNRNGAAR